MNATEASKRNEIAQDVLRSILDFHIQQSLRNDTNVNTDLVSKDAFTLADAFIKWGKKITPQTLKEKRK